MRPCNIGLQLQVLIYVGMLGVVASGFPSSFKNRFLNTIINREVIQGKADIGLALILSSEQNARSRESTR